MVTRWVDSEGRMHLDELPAEVAELLRASEPARKERLFRDGRAIERIVDDSDPDRPFRFHHFLGQTPTWAGPDGLRDRVELEDGRAVWECHFCGGQVLAIDDYCLGCDRCGRELEIPAPRDDEQPMPRSLPADGLRGGRS